MYSRHHLLQFLLICIVFSTFFGCVKPDDPGPNTGTLESFTVTVLERIPNRGVIEWTESRDIINGELVKYKVYLNNILIDSNLTRTRDTLYNLSAATEYQGLVLAYTATGDTASARFVLDKIDGFMVYGRDNHSIEAINPYTGTLLWNNPLTGIATGGTPAFFCPVISNDTVFIHNRFASLKSLFALNGKTGQLIWSALPYSAGFNTLFNSDITYNSGVLYGSTDEGLKAINSQTGQVLWTVQNTNNGFGTAPVVSNNVIYVGSPPAYRHFYALNRSNGSQIWQFQYQGQICSRPVLAKNLVIFVTNGTKVYALNQTTGALVWTKDFVGTNNFMDAVPPSPILINNNILFFQSVEVGCFALDVATGATVWSYLDGVTPAHSSATVADGTVYFNYEGFSGVTKLIAFNGTTGQQKWTTPVNTGLPVFAQNRIYLRYTNNIQIVNAVTGKIIDNLGPPVKYPVSVSINGKSYYNSYHGNFGF